MKKLICALVLLAMLVPVVAMAAVPSIPKQLDLDEIAGDNNVSFQFTDKSKSASAAVLKYAAYKQVGDKNQKVYEAEYYLNGELQRVRYFFDCGCVILFGADGTMMDEPSPDCNAAHTVGTGVSIKGIAKPKTSISEYVPVYSNASDLLAAIENVQGIVIKGNPNEAHLKKFADGLYAAYFGDDLKGIYAGSIVLDLVNDQLRMQGDPENSIHTWGIYDKVTGDLDHYGIFSKDRSLESVYDWKNRLKSYEYWKTNGDYWGYFRDNEKKTEEWRHGRDYDNSKVILDPPLDVLEAILLAPGAAEFAVSAVDSISKLDFEDKGTPVVIGHVDAQTKATMLDSHTSKFEMTDFSNQEFDEPISLLLPYGAGQNQAIAEGFTYTIVHEPKGGAAENYSTEQTEASQLKAEFTDKGILISGVTSFSPFTVTWGDKQASTASSDTSSLPSTGDTSNLLAFICLLAVSAGALLAMNKRRAHQ